MSPAGAVFVDTGILVGAALTGDRRHEPAAATLEGLAGVRTFTTDHVLVEAWAIINSRSGHAAAMRFWSALRETPLEIEPVGVPDLARAHAIAEQWADQAFDIVDCTSFAVMERTGCRRAATFDRDFAVYRFGPDRRKAFEILA